MSSHVSGEQKTSSPMSGITVTSKSDILQHDEIYAAPEIAIAQSLISYLSHLTAQASGNLNFRADSGHILRDLLVHWPTLAGWESEAQDLCQIITNAVYPLAGSLFADTVEIRVTISPATIVPVIVPDTLVTYVIFDTKSNTEKHCFASPLHPLTHQDSLGVQAGIIVSCFPLYYHFHRIKEGEERIAAPAVGLFERPEWLINQMMLSQNLGASEMDILRNLKQSLDGLYQSSTQTGLTAAAMLEWDKHLHARRHTDGTAPFTLSSTLLPLPMRSVESRMMNYALDPAHTPAFRLGMRRLAQSLHEAYAAAKAAEVTRYETNHLHNRVRIRVSSSAPTQTSQETNDDGKAENLPIVLPTLTEAVVDTIPSMSTVPPAVPRPEPPPATSSAAILPGPVFTPYPTNPPNITAPPLDLPLAQTQEQTPLLAAETQAVDTVLNVRVSQSTLIPLVSAAVTPSETLVAPINVNPQPFIATPSLQNPALAVNTVPTEQGVVPLTSETQNAAPTQQNLPILTSAVQTPPQPPLPRAEGQIPSAEPNTQTITAESQTPTATPSPTQNNQSVTASEPAINAPDHSTGQDQRSVSAPQRQPEALNQQEHETNTPQSTATHTDNAPNQTQQPAGNTEPATAKPAPQTVETTSPAKTQNSLSTNPTDGSTDITPSSQPTSTLDAQPQARTRTPNQSAPSLANEQENHTLSHDPVAHTPTHTGRIDKTASSEQTIPRYAKYDGMGPIPLSDKAVTEPVMVSPVDVAFPDHQFSKITHMFDRPVPNQIVTGENIIFYTPPQTEPWAGLKMNHPDIFKSSLNAASALTSVVPFFALAHQTPTPDEDKTLLKAAKLAVPLKTVSYNQAGIYGRLNTRPESPMKIFNAALTLPPTAGVAKVIWHFPTPMPSPSMGVGSPRSKK